MPQPSRTTGALRLGQAWPIERLNPILPAEGFGAEANYLVFDRLVYKDAQGKPVAGLVERWQVLEGGRKFVLTLRGGVRFHDGSPLTADDLIFTLDAIHNPENESYYRQRLKDLGAYEKLDDRTVSLRLDHPFWHLPELLDFGVLPAHLLRGRKLSDNEFNRHPIGTGPFRVVSIENGEAQLERNPTYYGVPAGLERISIATYNSDELWRRLVARQIQAALYVPWSKHRFLGHMRTIRTDVSARQFGVAICFNPERHALDRRELRRAFARAIDRERLVERTQFGFGKASQWMDPDESASADFDISDAKRLLKGRTLHLGVMANESNFVDIAMDLQRQLATADITITIDLNVPIEQADIGFCGDPDPKPPELLAVKYVTALNPEYSDVEEMFRQITQSADEAVRHALFKKIEQRVVEDPSKVILFWQPSFSAYRAEYCGYHMVNDFDGIEKMRPCQ